MFMGLSYCKLGRRSEGSGAGLMVRQKMERVQDGQAGRSSSAMNACTRPHAYKQSSPPRPPASQSHGDENSRRALL